MFQPTQNNPNQQIKCIFHLVAVKGQPHECFEGPSLQRLNLLLHSTQILFQYTMLLSCLLLQKQRHFDIFVVQTKSVLFFLDQQNKYFSEIKLHIFKFHKSNYSKRSSQRHLGPGACTGNQHKEQQQHFCIKRVPFIQFNNAAIYFYLS